MVNFCDMNKKKEIIKMIFLLNGTLNSNEFLLAKKASSVIDKPFHFISYKDLLKKALYENPITFQKLGLETLRIHYLSYLDVPWYDPVVKNMFCALTPDFALIWHQGIQFFIEEIIVATKQKKVIFAETMLITPQAFEAIVQSLHKLPVLFLRGHSTHKNNLKFYYKSKIHYDMIIKEKMATKDFEQIFKNKSSGTAIKRNLKLIQKTGNFYSQQIPHVKPTEHYGSV